MHHGIVAGQDLRRWNTGIRSEKKCHVNYSRTKATQCNDYWRHSISNKFTLNTKNKGVKLKRNKKAPIFGNSVHHQRQRDKN
jgi:hypothetical protein